MAEVEEHEHKSSGIAKAGLVTGIIGTALSSMGIAGGATGALGGILGGNGNKQQEKIDALRDENLLLKAEKAANSKTNALEIQVIELKGQVNNLQQALQFEGTQRQQGDAFVRQYVDDNFIRADKCVPAAKLNPPCVVWGTALPSYAQPIFPAPFPFPYPPVTPPAASSGGTTTTPANNGSTQGA